MAKHSLAVHVPYITDRPSLVNPSGDTFFSARIRAGAPMLHPCKYPATFRQRQEIRCLRIPNLQRGEYWTYTSRPTWFDPVTDRLFREGGAL